MTLDDFEGLLGYALRLHSRRSLRLLIYCDRLLYFDVMLVYDKVFWRIR